MANYRALFYVVTSRYLLRLTTLPVFLTLHVRNKIGLPRTFSSGRVMSGISQPAFQAPLWHFPVFRTCNVRMKNGLPRTFSSGPITSGNLQPSFRVFLRYFTVTVYRLQSLFCSSGFPNLSHQVEKRHSTHF